MHGDMQRKAKANPRQLIETILCNEYALVNDRRVVLTDDMKAILLLLIEDK